MRMPAASSQSHAATHGDGGFTLPELIAVLLVTGILAMTVLPKMQAALSFRDDAWRDQIVAALRYAHQVSVSHRRLVCASVASDNVAIRIASLNPAVACTATVPALDGQPLAANSKGAAAASISPRGLLYFQPSGRVSTDSAGVNTTNRTINVAGQAPIVLVGETGHVE